jgi:hypothetical protein
MWTPESLQTKTATLDLSSYGRPNACVTQLWNDRTELINIVEHVNWHDLACQFLICESCGIVGCKSQGWVEIRRSESIVLIMPAFTQLRDASKPMINEYLPPTYLLERGVICIEREIYESQFRSVAPFPNFEQLPELAAWAAAKLFQLESPNQVLGSILNPPELYPDIVIASSEGSFIEQTSALVSLVNTLSKSTDTIHLRRVTEADRLISLYLDISGYPEWAALSWDGLRYSLYLKPGYIIEQPSFSWSIIRG